MNGDITIDGVMHCGYCAHPSCSEVAATRKKTDRMSEEEVQLQSSSKNWPTVCLQFD